MDQQTLEVRLRRQYKIAGERVLEMWPIYRKGQLAGFEVAVQMFVLPPGANFERVDRVSAGSIHPLNTDEANDAD